MKLTTYSICGKAREIGLWPKEGATFDDRSDLGRRMAIAIEEYEKDPVRWRARRLLASEWVPNPDLLDSVPDGELGERIREAAAGSGYDEPVIRDERTLASSIRDARALFHQRPWEYSGRRNAVLPRSRSGLADLAYFLGYHSREVYDDGVARTLEATEGYESVQFFEDAPTDTQAVAFIYDGHAVIAFRGTTPSVGRDIVTDLKFWMTSKPKRHAGFHEAWRSIEEPVRGWISDQQQGLPLVLTGHSLGGALAILAACELRDDLPIASVMTFGAPRVGGRKFFLEHEVLDPLIWRFECGTDIITWISPRIFGYRHLGSRVPMTMDGGLEFPRSRSSSIGERSKKRPSHELAGPVERAVAAVSRWYQALPESTRVILHLVLISAGGSLVLPEYPFQFLFIAYLVYVVVRLVMWRIRRRKKDLADHGKDRYVSSLAKHMFQSYRDAPEAVRECAFAVRLQWLGAVAPKAPDQSEQPPETGWRDVVREAEKMRRFKFLR